MPTGVVKFFNAQRGFGFVTPTEGGDDLFVHQNNINMEGFRSLADGEAVEFQVIFFSIFDYFFMKKRKITRQNAISAQFFHNFHCC